MPAREFSKTLHQLGNNLGQGVVIPVASLAGLEEDIRVLGRSPQGGTIGSQGTGTEGGNIFGVDQCPEYFIIEGLALLHLMRGAEAVKEVEEGNAGFQRRRMGNEGHVLRLLHGGGAEQGKTCLPAGHDIGVVAEYGECMGCKCPGCHMHDKGEELPGHLVHVRNHEQKPLGGRKGGAHRTGQKHSMNGSRSSRLRLHLDKLG